MLSVAGLALVLFWIGLLVGVSFLATPAKFLAPSLTLPVALDVGRHTFAIFNRIEWMLAAALLVLVFMHPKNVTIAAGAAIAALIVVAEAVWLLPALDRRVGLIITGQQAPASNLHDISIAIEVAKLLLLGVVAFVTARRLARS
jgi:hypothetical protein